MSVPALRQPKTAKTAKNAKIAQKVKPPPTRTVPETRDFLIVTMKDKKKLVVSSDAYHGILTAGELYRCVFCETEMILDVLCKERHKTSENHRKILENHPHVEDFKENLIRKLTGATYYCTVCNVIVQSQFLHKHLSWEAHMQELNKACIRSDAYKPTFTSTEEFPPLPIKK